MMVLDELVDEMVKTARLHINQEIKSIQSETLDTFIDVMVDDARLQINKEIASVQGEIRNAHIAWGGYLAKWGDSWMTQERGADGRFGSGGGSTDVKAIESSVRSGATTKIEAAQLPKVLDHLASSSSSIDISKLDVQGKGNENLFTKSSLGLSRAEMPVLPAHGSATQRFAESLGSKGITAKIENVDPRTLTATQNQLDGRTVGQLLGRLRSGAYQADSRQQALMVSRDGSILDGHHRWAANAAYAVENPGHTVQILRVDASIGDLVKMAHEFTQGEAVTSRAFGS